MGKGMLLICYKFNSFISNSISRFIISWNLLNAKEITGTLEDIVVVMFSKDEEIDINEL